MLDRATLAATLGPIYRRANWWLAAVLFADGLLSGLLARSADTRVLAAAVGAATMTAFGLAAWRAPEHLATRLLGSTLLQVVGIVHASQARGADQGRFASVNAAIVLVVYEDAHVFWPVAIGLVAWHAVAAARAVDAHARTAVLVRLAAALAQVAIAALWAYTLRRRTIRAAVQQSALAAANVSLAAREAAAVHAVSLLEATLEATADGILVLDAEDRLRDANRRLAEMWGLDPAWLVVDASDTVRAHMGAQFVDPSQGAVRSHTGAPAAALADGRVERIALTGGRVFERMIQPLWVDGAWAGRVLSYRDVTTQVRAQAALASSEARFRAVFDHAGMGIVFCDEAGAIIDANRATQELLGYTAAELRGRAFDTVSPPGVADATSTPRREVEAGLHDRVKLERAFVRRDGTQLLGELTVTLVRTDGARGTVEMLEDITERRTLEAQLVRQALTDPLTGLANRVLFRDRVEHALARAARDGRRVAVLFVDLDSFKLVNDGLGHHVGDATLVAVGARLRDTIRADDTVARLGGDEFAVLLERLDDPAEAEGAAARVLEALRPPASVTAGDSATVEVFVAASIGIAVSEPGDDSESLLRNADVAMYVAKARGKAQAASYERGMHDRALARLRLDADLRVAVADLHGQAPVRAFSLRYQPIVTLTDGRVCGVEALVRWMHPERGAVSPLDFIHVAEDSGLIVPLGRWVLREACTEAATWPAVGGRSAPYVSVNLSARQLLEPSLVDDVQWALQASGLAASRLTLEITESVVMRDTSAVTERLRALKALGVDLAIDDFGTGYSSLAYLQRFPVDVLKIDKQFVDGVASSEDAAALTRTIVALADTLQLRTVAEGVEGAAQRDALRAFGCTMGQGYLFAEPLERPALRTFLGMDVPTALP